MSTDRKLPSVYTALIDHLRRQNKALEEVSDDELLRRLRRTHSDVARELDDMAGVPRSRVLDALYERDEALRSVPRSELARRLLKEQPAAAQRDPALWIEASLDQPPLELKPAPEGAGSLTPVRHEFAGLSAADRRRLGSVPAVPEPPFPLEQLQGRPALKPAESVFEGEAGVPGRFVGEQEQREQAARERVETEAPLTREEYLGNLVRAMRSPPIRTAASALGGALMFAEAPFRVVSEVGRLVARGAEKVGLPSNRPPEQFLSTRLADTLSRGQQILEAATRDPEAGWINNFLTRVLPQGMMSMLGFAAGARMMVMRGGFQPGPAVATLGAVQTGSEAVKEAIASGAGESERAINLAVGGVAGLLEALPIARWILPRAKGTWVRNLKEGVEEGLFQELPQRILQNAAAGATYDPERPLFRDAPESALAGLVLGAGGSRVADLWHQMQLQTPQGRGRMFSWLLNQQLPEFEVLARVLPPELRAALAPPAPIEITVTQSPAEAASAAITAAGGVVVSPSRPEIPRPVESGTGPAKAATPESAPKPEAIPEPARGPVPGAGPEVLGMYTPDEVEQAMQRWTVDDRALMAAQGTAPEDLLEAASAGELPRWLPLDNVPALTYYQVGRKARMEGRPPEEMMSQTPRPMIPVMLAGYGTGVTPRSPAPESRGATPAGPEPTVSVLTPIGREKFVGQYRYTETDLPAGMVVGGEYLVAGQHIEVPEKVPHDSQGRVPVTYAWVRVEDVVASHRPDGSPNPEYLLVNTRDYSNIREKEKLLDALRGWDPTLHAVFAPISAVGPPIVMLHGGRAHVVGGNSRAITIQSLPPVAFAQHSEVENQMAALFGLPPAPLDGQSYMLVRVMPKVAEALDDKQLAKILSDLFNESPARQQSTIEKALADAPKVSLDLLTRFAGYLSGDQKMEEAAASVLTDLMRAGLIDRNTRSPLVERPAEAQFYVQALIMAGAYGERATAIINRVMNTDVALLAWLGKAMMKPALLLRQAGPDGAVVADLISEFLVRVLRTADSGRLAQVFVTVASQLEPGNWKHSALVLGLAQLFANELVLVRTGKGGRAVRVDYDNSRDGFQTVIDHLIKVINGVILSRQHGIDLVTQAPVTLTDSLVEWLRRRTPALIDELERVANLPTGRDIGLFEGETAYHPETVAVMNSEGWGEALPPIPQRVLLEKFLAEHPDNAAARRRWLDLKHREDAEQARLAAAVKSGRDAREVIAEILTQRASEDKRETIGMHRRLRRLLLKRGQTTLSANEHNEIRYLETVLGQLFMDFLDTEARVQSEKALEARRRDHEEYEERLRKLSGTRSEPPIQGTLFDMPERYEGRREQYARLTARALYGQSLESLPESRQYMIYALVDDMLHLGAPSEVLHESAKPQDLFPPDVGRDPSRRGPGVSRTASRPTTPIPSRGARGQQSVLDLAGISIAGRRGSGSGQPQRPNLRVIVRHGKLLPQVTPLTHAEHYKWLLRAVPGAERLTAVQLEGVLRILANWFGGSGHFLLADGTGIGKTAQVIAASAVAAEQTGKPVLILAPDDRVIEDSYARDSEMLGVRLWRYQGAPIRPEQRLLVATYNDISRGVVNPLEFETVVFDEAQALRNDDLMSTRADLGIKTIQNATRVLLATATPMDEPWQIWYLTKVIGRNPEAALRELGIVVEYVNVNGETRRIYRLDDDANVSQDAVEAWLDKHFTAAMSAGNMVQREFSLGMLDVDAVNAALTRDQLKHVSDVYTRALDHAQRVLRMGAGRAKGYALLKARSALERVKIETVVHQAVGEIRQGRQVIIYLSRVSDPAAALPVAPEDSLASARLISDRLEAELGVNTVGRLFGGLSGVAGANYAAEVMQRFREGTLRVVVSTPQSGGTGLSLDDVYGDAPRTVFLVTAPFSAQEVVQIAGRVVRVTTRSRSKLVLVTSSSSIDSWNLGLVLRKLSTLGAVVGQNVRSILTPGTKPASSPPPVPASQTRQQMMIETAYEAAPDRADHFLPVDWEAWREMARRGSFATLVYRWAWGGGRLLPFSLIGRKVTGMRDLLALMQMLRNPAFEVSRFVVADGNGVIRFVLSVSAGSPTQTKVFGTDADLLTLARVINSYPGSRVYLVHNHPSGDPVPSLQDRVIAMASGSGKLRLLTGQPYDPAIVQAAMVISKHFAGAIVTDHLRGSLIEVTRDFSGDVIPNVQEVRLDPSELPSEYETLQQLAMDREEQEIRESALPEAEKVARLAYLKARREQARFGLYRDPLLITGAERYKSEELDRHTRVKDMIRRMGLPFHPLNGNYIAILMVDVRRYYRGVFWVSPQEFTNREMLLRRLHEAMVLFGAAFYYAMVPTDTNPPIVEQAAREYGDSGDLFTDILLSRQGGRQLETALRSYSSKEPAYQKLAETLQVPESLHLRDNTTAYHHQPPGGTVTPVTLGGLDHVHPLSMPLMVQLYRDLSGGMVPRIRRTLGTARGALVSGRMHPRTGVIELAADIFADPEYARRVLAHEIGHWVDWLPDKVITRGNLWGRLLSLRKYLKDTYGNETVTNQEFRSELIELSRWWRPWDPATASVSYRKYRDSAVELYADFISVLFNAPMEARARAPKFYAAFWKHLHTKEAVERSLLEIQTELATSGLEEADKRVVESILKGYTTAEERMVAIARERAELARSMKGWFDELLQELVDPFIPAERLERSKRGKLETRIHAKQRHRPGSIQEATEMLAMREVVNYRMLKRIHDRIVMPLRGHGVTLEDLGLYLQLRRIAHGDRVSLGNPEGLQPTDAARLLAAQEVRLGPIRFQVLQQAADLFHQIVFEVCRRAVVSGLISPRIWRERIVPNRRYYATFWVVQHVSDRITPLIRSQVGTFSSVANPFLATVLKLMSMNSTIAWNNAARAHVDFLRTYFPADIADTRSETTNTPGRAVLTWMEGGRLQRAEMDVYLVRAFQRPDPWHTLRVVRLLRNAFRYLIYPLIITYNLGYLYLVAPWKDLRRTAGNLPLNFPTLRLVRYYPQAIADAWRHYYGDDRPIIREMLDNLALGTPWDIFARQGEPGPGAPAAEAEFYQHMLKRVGVVSDTELRGWVQAWRRVFTPVARVLDAIEAGGLAINDAPKVAAYRTLVAHGFPRHQAARFARRQAGLPHVFRRGLKVSTWSALFPFWNVFIQGLRGDAEIALNPKSAPAYWWRWASTDGLAAALAGAASAGLLGWLLKELYDGIPEYDKETYTCIPIGIYRRDKDTIEPASKLPGIGFGDLNMTFGWKVVYLRIPRHETHRLLSGIVYHVMRRMGPDKDVPGGLPVRLLAFGADQLPGVNPVLTIAKAWGEYATGRVPMEPRTGRPILDYYAQRSGTVDSLAPMFHFTLSQMGVENFIRYDPEARTTFEMAVAAVPGLNRLIKVSDYGYHERQLRQDTRLREEELKAQSMLRYPTTVRRVLAEYNRLTSITPTARTPNQVLRLNRILYWRNNVFRPLDEQVRLYERQGMRDEAARLREQSAQLADVLLRELEVK